jgi:predicted HTH domain antitoxin
MATKVLEVTIPSDIFISLNEPEPELLQEMKLFTAIKFYEMNKLSIGKAARLAGMSRFEFETLLAKQHIPISNLNIADVEKDIEELQKI